VGLTVNAVTETYNRRPKAIGHADQLAAAVELDMAAAGWAPTVTTFLGRVPKARIRACVREALGEAAAERLADLKKDAMAEQAQTMLEGSGWLPEPLRTPGRPFGAAAAEVDEATPQHDGDTAPLTAEAIAAE
jgi:ParB family chromosome partitioning protein